MRKTQRIERADAKIACGLTRRQIGNALREFREQELKRTQTDIGIYCGLTTGNPISQMECGQTIPGHILLEYMKWGLTYGFIRRNTGAP